MDGLNGLTFEKLKKKQRTIAIAITFTGMLVVGQCESDIALAMIITVAVYTLVTAATVEHATLIDI